eukprot:12221098-Alexandrium_andersonii.AAC.1
MAGLDFRRSLRHSCAEWLSSFSRDVPCQGVRFPGGTRRHVNRIPIEPSSEPNRSNRVAPT